MRPRLGSNSLLYTAIYFYLPSDYPIAEKKRFHTVVTIYHNSPIAIDRLVYLLSHVALYSIVGIVNLFVICTHVAFIPDETGYSAQADIMKGIPGQDCHKTLGHPLWEGGN